MSIVDEKSKRKLMEIGYRGRNFMWVINNYSEKDIEYIQEWCSNNTEYSVYAKEVGESGTPHLQGFMMFKNAQRLGQIIRTWKNGGVVLGYISGMYAKDIDCEHYCKKDGMYWEVGDRPTPQQGKRKDLDQTKEMILAGATMREIVGTLPGMQAIKMAEAYKKYHSPVRNWKTQVMWYFGAPGSGKTKTANEHLPNAYWADSYRWWDGYDGHEEVIIDEFRGDWCTFNQLLKLIDRYPVRLEIKGGHVNFVAKRMIITSCMHPSEVYGKMVATGDRGTEKYTQLLRRITGIYHFTNQGFFAESKPINYETFIDQGGQIIETEVENFDLKTNQEEQREIDRIHREYYGLP